MKFEISTAQRRDTAMHRSQFRYQQVLSVAFWGFWAVLAEEKLKYFKTYLKFRNPHARRMALCSSFGRILLMVVPVVEF